MARFKEIKPLGAGGFGRTLLVEDLEKDGRRVVIKVPLNEELEEAIMEESGNNIHLRALLEKSEHPNIVQYLGVAKHEGRWVLMMEYVQGSDVRDLVGKMREKRPPLDLKLALGIAMNVCSGLIAAHKAHLCHYDIKPENIVVRRADGVAKLIDFGISQIIKTRSASSAGGTLPYMAPEVFHGQASFQADVWSLTVTLYELVTGSLPFPVPRGNPLQLEMAMKRAILNDDPQPPKQFNPKIDDRLNNIIMRGLEKKLENRFRNAQEMMHALEAHVLRGKDYVDEEIDTAREMFKQRKEEEAETALIDVLQRFPKKAQAYLALGEIYTLAEKRVKAEEILRKGIAQCPTQGTIYFNLAMALTNLKKQKEAIGALEKAIQLGLTEKQAKSAERLLRTWTVKK